jgi:acyl-CoA hydrolase
VSHSIQLTFLAEPSQVNFGGKIHGGMVMKWIDQAGYTCAAGWSGCYCVTVYVGGIRFLRPILVGDLVEVKAQVVDTGRTSMHIAVDVFASDPRSREARKTTHCIIVFVALDEAGKPAAVPAWQPEDEHGLQLQSYARRLAQLRKGIEEEMGAYLD